MSANSSTPTSSRVTRGGETAPRGVPRGGGLFRGTRTEPQTFARIWRTRQRLYLPGEAAVARSRGARRLVISPVRTRRLRSAGLPSDLVTVRACRLRTSGCKFTIGVMLRPGAERTEVEPAWPRRLTRPATPLVYLDLNQWISLAKAASGHADGARFQSALDVLRARRAGWTYVIGMPLIIELTGNLRRAQRANLGRVIEEFTHFASLLPLTAIAALEFDAALARCAQSPTGFRRWIYSGRASCTRSVCAAGSVYELQPEGTSPSTLDGPLG